jgi:hypothetical protein
MATIGKTELGGSIANGASSLWGYANRYDFPQAGTLTHLSVYVAGGGSTTQTFRLGFYSNSSDNPYSRLAYTNYSTVAAAQAAGWVTLPVLSNYAFAAGKFWIAQIWGYSNAGANQYRETYASCAETETDYANASYTSNLEGDMSATPPLATWPTSAYTDRVYVQYATYTPAGSDLSVLLGCGMPFA